MNEVLNLFDFVQFEQARLERSIQMDTGSQPNSVITPKDRIDYQVQAWKLSIEVQQHFNTIEMQIRNIAITLVGGAIAAAAALYKESAIPSSRLILFAGLLIWSAFFLMDRYWYHKLLIGSVIHAQEIEKDLISLIPGIELSTDIGKFSPIIIRKDKLEIHTNGKIWIFYGLIFIILLGLAIFI